MKLTMLGSGVRAPFVLHGLAERQRDLGLTEVVLHDTDHERLEVMAALGAFLCRSWGATFLGVPGDQVHADYFGLNHCGWIHRVLVDGRDRLPELLDRYDELRRLDHQWRLFETELVRSIGMLPMEYLYFYHYREQAVENILRSGGTRAAQIAAINDALWPVLRARIDADDPAGAADAWTRAMQTRDETYFARERGEALIVPTSPEIHDELVEGEGYAGVATAVML